MAELLTDPELLQTTFVTIDFETLTPAGRRPAPIEVAAQARKLTADGTWRDEGRFEALIRPPQDVPVTGADTAQTGITAVMLRDASPADVVLAGLDRLLAHPPYVLVAQNAPYEAGILYDWAASCPTLARIPLLDTVRLARRAYPDLPSRRLDDLLRHMKLPIPAGRHRAMPDVEATSAVFARLLADGAAAGLWTTLDQLYQVAGIVPKAVTGDEDAAKPRQEELF